MNIVVLAGGLSTERDVSLETGRQVTRALRENGHQVMLLDVFMGYGTPGEDIEGIFNYANEINIKDEGILEEAPDIAKIKASRKDQSANFFGPNVIRICSMSDIVFMGLHGANGEDGRIQAAFDLYAIKYTGTGHVSSAIAMDKQISKQFFIRGGIPTPKGVVAVKGKSNLTFDETGMNLPCVVKPNCGGSSIGTTIVRSKDEYERALLESFRFEEKAIVEQFVEGREFSVATIKRRALPVIEIAPIKGFYDYKNKYKAGSAVETCPADLPTDIAKQMQAYAVRVAEVMGLDTYARTDFLLSSNNEIYCLEANTLPGMTPTSLLPQEAKAEGISFNELCEELIRISLEKYRN